MLNANLPCQNIARLVGMDDEHHIYTSAAASEMVFRKPSLQWVAYRKIDTAGQQSAAATRVDKCLSNELQ